jgi:hypothetical protein
MLTNFEAFLAHDCACSSASFPSSCLICLFAIPFEIEKSGYHVGGTRYCARIQRAHKSNQIYFVADMKHGLVFQKCFDPECRGFSTFVTSFHFFSTKDNNP